MSVKLLTEYHLEFLSLKRRLHRLIRVYTCENATLLEITCHGSFVFIQNIFLGEDIRKQLPRESAEFDDVNVKWKVIMTRLNKDKNALRGTHHEGRSKFVGSEILGIAPLGTPCMLIIPELSILRLTSHRKSTSKS